MKRMSNWKKVQSSNLFPINKSDCVCVCVCGWFEQNRRKKISRASICEIDKDFISFHFWFDGYILIFVAVIVSGG